MSTQEKTPLTLAPEVIELLSEASAEIEQLAKIIGTWPDNPESLLALRGLSIRISDLNSVIGCAFFRDSSFQLKEAVEKVRGPGHWRSA